MHMEIAQKKGLTDGRVKQAKRYKIPQGFSGKISRTFP